MWTMRRNLFGTWRSNEPSRFFEALLPENIEIIEPGGRTITYSPPHGHSRRSGYTPPSMAAHNSSPEHYSQPPGHYPAHLTNKGMVTIESKTQQYATAAPYPRQSTNSAKEKKKAWSVGEPIWHRKFGDGVVVDVEETSLTVEFEQYGRRNIVASYTQPVCNNKNKA